MLIKEIRGLRWSEIPSQSLDSCDDIRYAIGTEGCVNKFNHDMEDILYSNRSFPQGLTLITPRVGEKIFSRFVQLVTRMCENYAIEYIVVNDYGVLNALQLDDIKIVLGRTLIRSLAYAPWSSNLIRDESEQVKRNLLLPNIIHSSKMDFFKKYHIYAVELCATPMLESAATWLNKEGIKIFYHNDTTIASIGRTCPYARLLHETASCCTYQCEDVLNINICKIWSAKTCLYEDADGPTREVVPKYLNIENVLYYRTEDDTAINSDFDTIVFHSQFGNPFRKTQEAKLQTGELL